MPADLLLTRGVYKKAIRYSPVVGTFVNGTFQTSVRKEGSEIYEALITHNDEYFLLEDFHATCREAQEKIDALYRDKKKNGYMTIQHRYIKQVYFRRYH